MFGRKSSFTPSNFTTSNMKSQRKYPQSEKIESVPSVSPMKQQKRQENIVMKPFKTLSPPQAIIAQPNGTQRFFFLKQDAVVNLENPDPTLLWTYQVTNMLIQTQKRRTLVFKQQEYIINGYSGDGYPQVIFICADQVHGYLDQNGIPTPRVAALILVDICPLYDTAQVKISDLRYQLKDPVAWDLPMTVTTLNLRVQIDDITTPIPLPLTNPLTINFEIRRV